MNGGAAMLTDPDISHVADDELDRAIAERNEQKQHGNTGNDHNRTQNQDCNGCKNNALDTAEFSNKSRRQISIFHLRFSFAYSVGVHPVIFLNEIPK